jgi:hypothetical protein
MAAAATSTGTEGGGFLSVLNSAVSNAASSLDRQVTKWAEKLNAIADDPLASGALKAALHGENIVWGAVKGAWQDGTPAMKAVIVTGVVAAVVLLLVSPVLLLVYLLSLLVIAAVQRARSTEK